MTVGEFVSWVAGVDFFWFIAVLFAANTLIYLFSIYCEERYHRWYTKRFAADGKERKDE